MTSHNITPLEKLFDSIGSQSDFGNAVIGFKSSSYPFLFVSFLLKSLKATHQLESVDLSEQEMESVIARGQTMFLGQRLIFLIKNSDLLSEKKKKIFFDFLKGYQGPHTMLIPLIDMQDEHPLGERAVYFDLNTALSAQLLNSFFALGNIQMKRAESFIPRITTHFPKLTLDQACLLMNYLQVAGGDSETIVYEWFAKIIATDSSLYTLSQYFFAKNKSAFLHQWIKVETEYSAQFWMSFFSEQLFRATQVVGFMHAKQYAQAKTIGYRLPYSFLGQDWKNYRYDELKAAHDHLYEMDHSIKNGAELSGFDQFFIAFFHNLFAKQTLRN